MVAPQVTCVSAYHERYVRYKRMAKVVVFVNDVALSSNLVSTVFSVSLAYLVQPPLMTSPMYLDE